MATLKYKNGDSWIDILHPIGSFYFSNSDESPSVLFGGTWTQITGAAIRGNTSIGYIGADTHILTSSEMPVHYHEIQPGQLGSQAGWNTSGGSGDKLYYAQTVPARNIFEFYSRNTTNTGGGNRTVSCSAPTTAISGTEQPNSTSLGGGLWLGLVF